MCNMYIVFKAAYHYNKSSLYMFGQISFSEKEGFKWKSFVRKVILIP